LSGIEAASIQRVFSQISSQSETTTRELKNSVVAAANLAGVLPGEIFKEMAQNGDDRLLVNDQTCWFRFTTVS